MCFERRFNIKYFWKSYRYFGDPSLYKLSFIKVQKQRSYLINEVLFISSKLIRNKINQLMYVPNYSNNFSLQFVKNKTNYFKYSIYEQKYVWRSSSGWELDERFLVVSFWEGFVTYSFIFLKLFSQIVKRLTSKSDIRQPPEIFILSQISGSRPTFSL